MLLWLLCVSVTFVVDCQSAAAMALIVVIKFLSSSSSSSKSSIHSDVRISAMYLCVNCCILITGVGDRSCKGKGLVEVLMKLRLTATGCYLYGITQYLPPDTSEHARLNPSHTGQYSIYLPWRDGRLSWPRWLVTYWDGLPAHTHPRPGVELTTCWSQVRRPDHYTTKPPGLVVQCVAHFVAFCCINNPSGVSIMNKY